MTIKTRFILFFLCVLASTTSEAQSRDYLDSLPRRQRIKIDPLTPSRAAFYSAVIPGLGQIHTRRYWTLPFIYGGLGVSLYYYNFQNREMKKYRAAYKQRIRGDFSDEWTNRIPRTDQLVKGMEFHENYRDLSILWFVGIYLLNVLDANVGAHLLQFNVDDNLTFQPYLNQENIMSDPSVGLAFQIKF